MNILRCANVLAAAVAATLSLQAADARAQTPVSPPSIEQLAAFPALSSISVSPDGQHIAALQADGEEQVAVVWRADALDQAPTRIGAGRMKFSSVSFIKDGLLAVNLWQPYELRTEGVVRTFISKFFITDIQGKQWKEPLAQSRAGSRAEELRQSLSNASVLDNLPNDPDHILVVSGSGSNAGDVYKVNIRNYSATRIQMSEERVAGYRTDLEGELRARTRADTDGTGAFIATEFRQPGTTQWVEHFRSYVKDRDVTEVLGFADDPNIAFMLSNVGRDKSVIYEYDIAARQQKEVLFENRMFNASNILINRQRGVEGLPFGQIMALGYAGPAGDDLIWTAPQMQAIDQALRPALGIESSPLEVVDSATGQRSNMAYDGALGYRLVSRSSDLKTLILSRSGAGQPAEYFMLRNGQLSLLAKSHPQLDNRALGQTRLTYYTARDGLDIPALLTTPSTELCGAGPWPAVVHPHGGPWARDYLGFDGSMWVPLMASRCMAVLQPQFRGSADWGRRLWMAGDAQWGQAMQDDKDDGARWMIEQGIAQPGRVAMFGFSYGGYAAFAAAIRPNGLYKCAIAGAGVSDIKKIWARFYTNPFFRQAQAPTVDGLNPLDHAASISIPLMVFHGDRDQIVPIEQSQWFVDRARQAGHDVTWHPIADYAHGPAWTRAVMAQQLGVIDDYLRDGCGGGGL